MKTKKDYLIKEIADDFIIYMKSGKVGITPFLKDPNLNINNLEQLLKIHFLLKKEVKDFVSDLPKMIRKFKTSTNVSKNVSKGAIKGQIDWNRTVQYQSNYNDKTVFICNENNKFYNIKENLVLKELLFVLHKTLFKDIRLKKLMGYSWFEEWELLSKVVNEIYKKNIYIGRIKEEKIKVSDKMIKDTLKHRNPLYRESAKLLSTYRKIMSNQLNKEEVKELLSNTFILPNKAEKIFELYWVMQIIKNNTSFEKLNIIDGTNNMVASWEDDNHKFEIYHDSVGSGQIMFNISLDEVDNSNNPFLQRKIESRLEANKLASQIFSKNAKNIFWSGRPDIVLEITNKETNKLEKVVLGEVKYTSDVSYAITGLQELYDYIMLVKDKNNQYLNREEVDVKGMLFLDKIETQDYSPDLVNVVTMNNKVDLKI